MLGKRAKTTQGEKLAECQLIPFPTESCLSSVTSCLMIHVHQVWPLNHMVDRILVCFIYPFLGDKVQVCRLYTVCNGLALMTSLRYRTPFLTSSIGLLDFLILQFLFLSPFPFRSFSLYILHLALFFLGHGKGKCIKIRSLSK